MSKKKCKPDLPDKIYYKPIVDPCKKECDCIGHCFCNQLKELTCGDCNSYKKGNVCNCQANFQVNIPDFVTLNLSICPNCENNNSFIRLEFTTDPSFSSIIQSTQVFNPQCYLSPAGLVLQVAGYGIYQDNETVVRINFIMTIVKRTSGEFDITFAYLLVDPITGNTVSVTISLIGLPEDTGTLLFCNNCEGTPQVLYPPNGLAIQQGQQNRQVTVTITRDGNTTTQTFSV